jgi:hypothetical protein
MHLSPNRQHRTRLAQVSLFLLAVILTGAGIAGLATGAKAAPVTLTFDHGQMSLGGIITERVILPASSQFPSDDLPAPQRTDIQLIGNQNGGSVSFPAALNTGAQFPYMHVLSPTDNTLRVPFTFRLRPPGLSGSYDAATGRTELNGAMDVYVVVGLGATPNPLSPADVAVPPLGLFGRCKLPNVPVSFSTETKSPFTAERFTGGFGVNGALTTAWEDVPQAVPENVTPEQEELCGSLNTIIHGEGGIWLSNGITSPVPQPVPEPTCADDLRYCPVPTYVAIERTKLTPRKKAVRRGKKVKLKVTVRNAGTRDAKRLKVRLRSSNRRVKVPKRLTMKVPAGSSASKTVRVKVKRKAKGRKAVITASAGGMSGRATLKIRGRLKG